MMQNRENVELLPLVDSDGNVLGQASRAECHSPLKLLHPVVHLHVINEKGDILLQKRSLNKTIQPGKWDTAVGGHVDAGEEIKQALYREAKEELGITEFEPILLDKYLFESPVEKEFIYSFGTVTDYNADHFNFSRDEIDCVKFFTLEELQVAGNEDFTPNFLLELERISQKLKSILNSNQV